MNMNLLINIPKVSGCSPADATDQILRMFFEFDSPGQGLSVIYLPSFHIDQPSDGRAIGSGHGR
jgi:hypothetical protein